MRRRLSLNGLIVALAAAVAVLLTLTRPSPEGLIGLGVGEREVRAAPGDSALVSNKHNLTGLKVFNLTLVRIRDAYVDPGRISPKEMLYAALDSVQFDIPEVLVEPYRHRDEIAVVVNDKRQTFSTADVDSPWRLAATLRRIFRFIEANINPGGDLAQVEYAAVNGMLRTLDPHSVLLDPETAREMDVNTSGKFGGLGIVIRIQNRKLTVVRPIKGTPAYRQGVERGDHIIKINEETTETLTLQEAVDRMRGDPGTPVTLWVERKGHRGLLRFDITRALISVESVNSKMLDKKIGYIRIMQFSGRTVKEVANAMRQLQSQGARAWILDLRWNPGGLLEQAIQVADLFVDKGTIVTTVGGRERDPRRAQRKHTDNTTPITVLVNGNSASASEIVAGALKNLDRAVVIGNRTFGKGSVQILYDNADGSKLKLTIAQYLTPGDRSIQSVGITPDIDLTPMYVPKENKGPRDQIRLLRASHSYREADLHAHLTSQYAKQSHKPTYELHFLHEPAPGLAVAPTDQESEPSPFESDPPLAEEEPGDEEMPFDDEIIEDFEMQLAREILAEAQVPRRRAILRSARRIIHRTQAEQEQRLAAALARLGVDWSAPESDTAGHPALHASVRMEPGSHVKAGDVAKLVGTVTNNGNAPAYQVHLRIKTDDRVFDDTELAIGRIASGETKSAVAYIDVPKDALDRVDLLTFELREARGAKAAIHSVKYRVSAADRPVFAYSHQLIDDGNGDGLVQRNELHRLRVTIKNTGKGISENTTALLRNASGEGVLVKKGRFALGALKPGQAKSTDFVFQVSDELRDEQLVLEMTVYDSVLHESVRDKLKYPIRSASRGPEKARGLVRTIEATPIYEGASADSGLIGRANPNTVFRVAGRKGGWYKVQLEADRPGFVQAAHIRPTNLQAGKPDIVQRWQVTPPAITLQLPTLETRRSHYLLRGVAVDDAHVEDVYVIVSNRDAKIENRKVDYKSNRGGKRSNALSFASNIPLWPGSNLVTVVARENNAVRSSHSLFIYRAEGGPSTASAK